MDASLKREIAYNKAVYHAQIAVFGTFVRNLLLVDDSASIAPMKQSILSKKPKNPMNGYNLFIYEHMVMNPDLSVKQVSHRFCEMWNNKSYSEKAEYRKRAASLY